MQDIPRLLDEAVCSLMKDRPQDALDFLSTHFKTLAGERAAARSCNGNGGSDKAAPAAAEPATAEPAPAPAPAPAGEAGTEASSPSAAANAAADGDAPQKRRVKEITARACVVCGRDDRAGEVRSAGFKCTECIGQPSGKFIRKDLETSEKLMKGRDEEGMFVINDYTILANLGEGAYGKVRLCVHNQSQQSYAVKFLSKVCGEREREREREGRCKRRAPPIRAPPSPNRKPSAATSVFRARSPRASSPPTTKWTSARSTRRRRRSRSWRSSLIRTFARYVRPPSPSPSELPSAPPRPSASRPIFIYSTRLRSTA